MKHTLLAFLGAVVVASSVPNHAVSQGLIEGFPMDQAVVSVDSNITLTTNWQAIGEKLAGKWEGQCVAFIQRLYGSYYTDPSFRGWAYDIKPNALLPVVGSVVLESGKNRNYYHASIVTEVTDEYIVVLESNLRMDERVTYGRKILRSSPKIRGYFHFERNVIHLL